MTRDPPTTTGLCGCYDFRSLPAASPTRSFSAAFGGGDPLRNSCAMTGCTKRRAKELRNGYARLRRRVREEREVHIQDLELSAGRQGIVGGSLGAT